MTTEDLLKQGIAALNAGRKAEARNLLTQVVQQDDRNEMAWLWLSGAVDTDEERHTCLENVLAINPNNGVAKRGLESLIAKEGVRSLSVVSSPTPSAEPAATPTEQSKQPPAKASAPLTQSSKPPQPSSSPSMTEFITLTCPSCGGKLQITNGIDRFVCGYCGTEQVVRRAGGIISLIPVVEGLAQVQVGVDKTASELAIKRLESEIADLGLELARVRSVGLSNDLLTDAFGGTRYEQAMKKALWHAGKKRGLGYYLRLNAPGYIAQALAEIPIEELEEAVRYVLDYNRNSKVRSTAESLLRTTRIFEEKLEEKQAQLRKHQEIVSQ